MRSAALLTILLVCVSLHAATLPAGFTEVTLASGLSNPTAFTIAPDGRIFVCQQGGALRVVRNDALLPTPMLTLSVSSTGERGLLGVAVDPDFLTNRYVYVYYTTSSTPIHNRVSRFTTNGDLADPASEVVLLELETLSATNHNGGAIHFGADGKLYVAVGENAVPSNAQTLQNRLGKMLRINRDGTIPSDNPFYATASGANRSIWALGLRNPFTFGVHPLSGRIFINDVGQSAWEEINDGVAGGNYGWPATEGPTSDPDYISPIHFYANSNAVECAIAGGTFYAPEIRQFPQTFVESHFFSDLCGGWIRRLDASATPGEFATALSNPVDLRAADDGALLYLARGGGVLRRVQWNEHLEGDVNDDGKVTNADLFYLANHLHGGGPAPVQGGDVDANGVINTLDLAYLSAYVLGRGETPRM